MGGAAIAGFSRTIGAGALQTGAGQTGAAGAGAQTGAGSLHTGCDVWGSLQT